MAPKLPITNLLISIRSIMEILSWNVNGLRAVVRKGFLDFLKRAKPDILCLQEIKISDVAYNNLISLPIIIQSTFNTAKGQCFNIYTDYGVYKLF